MALELLSKKVSCKYKHNSLKETLSCLLTLFHLQPPLIKHTPNTHIPCHPHQMRTWVFSCSEWERPLHQRAFQQRPPERRKEAFFFFFAAKSVPSLRYATLRQVFYTSVLTLEDAPTTPLPTSPQLPFAKKKKKRPKQHVTTHPAKYIQICLPKEGKKRRRRK